MVTLYYISLNWTCLLFITGSVESSILFIHGSAETSILFIIAYCFLDALGNYYINAHALLLMVFFIVKPRLSIFFGRHLLHYLFINLSLVPELLLLAVNVR